MTTVLLSPDKFKGSLSAAGVADALARGIADVAPDWVCVRAPIADGGDGTVDAAVAAGWERVAVETTGPTGVPHITSYARGGPTAVVELASAVGLELLPGGEPDALGATTFGLGTVIRHALVHGAQDIVLGLGGSASTDGGAGMLQALGVTVTDRAGEHVRPGGTALLQAARVDLSGLLPEARAARFTLACDVDNPLLGPDGAAAVYGPQKGASPRRSPCSTVPCAPGPTCSRRRRAQTCGTFPAPARPAARASARWRCSARWRGPASTSCSSWPISAARSRRRTS